jgi:sugar lactone lactonase YvrE
VTTVIPRRFMGVASDGTHLYATTYDTIEQVAPSQTVLVGGGRKSRHDPDGLAEEANVSDATSPAWDGAGLVFITNGRLRRFDPASRHVTTLGVPTKADDALRGTLVGIGSLGGSRIAIGFREPATFIVFDIVTGARETFPLDVPEGTRLKTLVTDGSDRVFFTDRDGRAWFFTISTRWLRRIDAIAEADIATALVFAAPDRLFVALETPKTIARVDLASMTSTVVATGMQRTTALAVDATRNALYVSDAQILRIDLATGATEAVTDLKYAGALDGPRGVARLTSRDHMAVAPDGNLYVASHTAIRHIRVSDGFVSTALSGLQRPEAMWVLPNGELLIADGKQNVVLRARL